MNLNKYGKKMLFGYAATLKKDNPSWSDHTCVEESFIKCAGMGNYNSPIDYLVPEFQAYYKKLTNEQNPDRSVARDDAQ